MESFGAWRVENFRFGASVIAEVIVANGSIIECFLVDIGAWSGYNFDGGFRIYFIKYNLQSSDTLRCSDHLGL